MVMRVEKVKEMPVSIFYVDSQSTQILPIKSKKRRKRVLGK